MTKSIGKVNLSTCTSTLCTTPYGHFIDRSTRCKIILVCLTSRHLIFSSIDKGIKVVSQVNQHLPNSQISNCAGNSKATRKFELQRGSLLNDCTVVALDFDNLFLYVLFLLSMQIFQKFGVCQHLLYCFRKKNFSFQLFEDLYEARKLLLPIFLGGY